MIQRVGIAQALLNDPEVVFLDEPMSGLDPLGRRDVRSLILELRDQGRTVFFSSHILADAEALCSRVAVVAGGRLAAAGRLTDILAFQVRGWELVDRRPAAGGARAASRRSSTQAHRDLAAALRARAAARPAARAAALGADRHRRDARVAQSAARHARGLLRPARRRDRRRRARRRPGRSRMRAISCGRGQRLQGVGPRPRALQPRALRGAADRLLVPARPADGRPGRQDHQGSRARGDRRLRPVHRHLHRHRPGLEGGRAAQHLRAARQADQPAAVHRRQVRRAGADAGRQRRGDDAGALRRARLPDLCRRRRSCARRGTRRASIRGCCMAIAPDLRRADDRHGDRAVLLDVLDAAALRRADVRPVRRRPLQRRSEELRPDRRVAAGDLAGARRLPRPAGLLGLRRQDGGRARPAGRRRLPRRDRRLRPGLHRGAAGRCRC